MCEGKKAINVFSAIKSRSEWTEDGSDFIIIYIIFTVKGREGRVEWSDANERERKRGRERKVHFSPFHIKCVSLSHRKT